ncbi:hypothetical protein M0805_004246 [Coniferiporia weirii]|nr:hypothetical protein M0805_004246 [Coniferiporia weirii]
MNSEINTHLTTTKVLPPLAKDDDLPPPPSPLRNAVAPPPLPPPKITLDDLQSDPLFERGHPLMRDALSPLDIAASPGSPSFPSDSLTVLGPPSPTISMSESVRPKKVNPFVDLIETEKMFVDTLSGIIRKVASAWSRSNLPPPELDSMFRAVGAVFKANRSFQSKLKEIGPSPSSPRAIGDLLMKWIDQLDSPYTNYCSTYLSGFDSWEPAQCNERLSSVLDAFSTTNPPPQPGPQNWTLDALFLLPYSRIKYYQKLYGRLLKNSAPGKSTDKKLIEAVGKLERLLAVVEERSSIPLSGPSLAIETTDEVVIDTREKAEEIQKPVDQTESLERVSANGRTPSEETIRLREEFDVRTSVESSARGSSLSSGQWSSRDTALTSEGRASVSTLSMSMSDLERRLATERCRDLFTMNPRSVRLSINSPNLPYTREIRLSEDSAVHFTPKSTNIGVIHRQGHIFLLTDLFLICERMTPEDRVHDESEYHDMWLCYPPLAAKHLRVAPLNDNSLEITILKKEVMILHFDSVARRDYVMREFKSTTNMAASLPPPSKQAPPPMPTLNNLLLSSSGSAPADRHFITSITEPFSPRSTDASSRTPSPASGDPSMHRLDPVRSFLNETSSPHSESSLPLSIAREGGPPGPPPYSASNDATGPSSQTRPPGPQPTDLNLLRHGQSIRNEDTHPTSLDGSISQRSNVGGGSASFSPGQILPPRGDSVRVPPPMNRVPSPRDGMSPPPINGMYLPRNAMSPPPIAGMNPLRNATSPPPMNRMNGPPMNGMNDPPMNGMNGPPMNGMNGPPMNGMNGSLMNGMNGPPRNMTSPPPMGGNGMPPRMGPISAPPRGGSLGSRAIVGGPGPGSENLYSGPHNQFSTGGHTISQHMPPYPGAPFANPSRPSSDPSYHGGLHKTPSLHSLGSQFDPQQQPPRSAPPVPNKPNGFPRPLDDGANGVNLRPMLPPAALPRIASAAPAFGSDDSPPPSPTERVHTGPIETSILATMKCKVFLQQQHAQWKSLGSAKLTLYEQRPTMVKQLVVEADSKDKTMLISTIVLTDGVERVGKTGVAIELSDSGTRTGIVYMIQLRNEKSAGGLFESLLAGSDRGGFKG